MTPAGLMRKARIAPVFKGTAFENRCLRLLRSNLSMTLERVGGASDGGIDLQGWWWLPPLLPNPKEPSNHDLSSSFQHSTIQPTPTSQEMGPNKDLSRRRIRVLGQCKAEAKKMGPKYVREMEGVVLHYQATPTPSPPKPIVGLLLSESAFTKATILRSMSSPVPFLLLHLPPFEEISGTALPASDKIGTIIWNPALGTGLLSSALEARWEYGSSDSGKGHVELWWRGQRLENWIPGDPSCGEKELVSDVTEV